MKIFHINNRSLSSLRRRARKAAKDHREVCGAVISDANRTLTLKHLRNLSKEPSKWRINTRSLRYIRRDLKGSGLRLVGTFHSHTRGYANPSQGDLNHYPVNFLMLIYDVIDDAFGLWRPIKAGKSHELRCLPIAKGPNQTDIMNARKEVVVLLERNLSNAKRKRPNQDLKRMLARAAERRA